MLRSRFLNWLATDSPFCALCVPYAWALERRLVFGARGGVLRGVSVVVEMIEVNSWCLIGVIFLSGRLRHLNVISSFAFLIPMTESRTEIFGKVTSIIKVQRRP